MSSQFLTLIEGAPGASLMIYFGILAYIIPTILWIGPARETSRAWAFLVALTPFTGGTTGIVFSVLHWEKGKRGMYAFLTLYSFALIVWLARSYVAINSFNSYV